MSLQKEERSEEETGGRSGVGDREEDKGEEEEEEEETEEEEGLGAGGGLGDSHSILGFPFLFSSSFLSSSMVSLTFFSLILCVCVLANRESRRRN